MPEDDQTPAPIKMGPAYATAGSSSLVGVVAWLMHLKGIDMPPDVQAYLTTLVTFAGAALIHVALLIMRKKGII